MSKKLAIKGHPTRGKEVIELLEMMGGYKDSLLKDDDIYDDNYFYFILAEENNAIDGYPLKYKDKVDEDYVIFTLEEFLEKYPFKIHDFVHIPEYESEADICGMRWDPTCQDVEYLVYRCDDEEWYTTRELLKYNDNPNNTPKNKEKKQINQMPLANCDLDEVEIVLGDKFELKTKDGKYYAVRKKPKYPTTFEECLNMLYCKSVLRHIIGHKAELLFNLEKLLICRDAYWKIAGEQMGLDKPWEPDWKHLNRKFYCIYNSKNNIVKNVTYGENKILAFPTEEMRDAFYENFKNLIEECKELL